MKLLSYKQVEVEGRKAFMPRRAHYLYFFEDGVLLVFSLSPAPLVIRSLWWVLGKCLLA